MPQPGRKPEEQPSADILKKLQEQSSTRKREQALRILTRPQQKPSAFWLWYKNLKTKMSLSYESRKKQIKREAMMSHNRHLAIISIFFAGALWVSWAIEDKYDKMRRRANSTKSMKQQAVQAENRYIQSMLAKNPFEAVPIEEEEKEEENYLYQKAELQFDTKADLLQVLQDEKRILEQQDQGQL